MSHAETIANIDRFAEHVLPALTDRR